MSSTQSMRKRMPKRIHRGPMLLAGALAWMAAGAALAQVPDGEWLITDETDSGTTAGSEMNGDTMAVVVSAICVPFPEGNATTGSAIEFRADHPDGASLKKSKGTVEQADKSNPGTVRLITGSGTFRKTTTIQCKKVEIEASVKTKKSPSSGKFSAKASDCDCPLNVQGTCNNFTAQSNDLSADCKPSKSIKFDFWSEKNLVRKIKVKGKGDASLTE